MTSPRGPQPPVPPRRAPYPPQQQGGWAPPAQGHPAQGYAYPPGYPQPQQPGAGRPPNYPPPGYGYAAPPGARPPVKSTSHVKMLAILGVALIVAVGAFVAISHFVTPAASTAKTCDPTCGGPPPVGPAVSAKPRFTASDGSWSVEYPTDNPNISGYKKSATALLANIGNGFGELLVQGGSAGGSTPQQIVQAFQQKVFPDARPAYEISHAEVGYNPGFGAVYDDYPQSTSGSSQHMRVIALAAVRNNTYVLVVGLGPYQVFSRDGINNEHPSGAATQVAFFMDSFINTVEWKGDPAR